MRPKLARKAKGFKGMSFGKRRMGRFRFCGDGLSSGVAKARNVLKMLARGFMAFNEKWVRDYSIGFR